MDTSVNRPVSNAENTSSGNYQGIIIIVLAIIGIILFIYLLVEFVDIPPVTIAPFSDGSIIKIKSLGNNKYLRPVSCSNLQCSNLPQDICGSGSRFEAVVADAVESDFGTEWILCQYKGSSPTSTTEAIYMVYNGRDVDSSTAAMHLPDDYEFLVVDNDLSICPSLASIPLKNNPGTNGCNNIPVKYYLNFILMESANPGKTSSFNQNGTYQIRFFPPNDYDLQECGIGLTAKYLYNSSIPNPNTTCNNLVQVYDINTGNPDRNNIKEKLNYAFFIQVVNK